MSASCHSESNFDGASPQYRRVLLIVIAINAMMFVVELSYGIVGQSQALKADALDFLGDSATYALSLWAIGRSIETRANVAMIKGVSLLLMAVWVLSSTVYYMFVINSPSAPIMINVALAALTANLISVVLLMKFRDGDANIRSVWLCSRNDAIGNLMVLIAAGVVLLSDSRWPDLIVALILAGLFANSALQIISQSRGEHAESKGCAGSSDHEH
ncbi:MAG: Co/Zn/Cd efflux system component [Saprospiraceae bacterium]|jgi:Co/Zn/Cd efflux system component